MSARPSTDLPWICSGLCSRSSPTSWPVPSTGVRQLVLGDAEVGAGTTWSGSSSAPGSTRTLAGLTSRCTNPSRCAASSARPACLSAITHHPAGNSRRLSSTVRRSEPRHSASRCTAALRTDPCRNRDHVRGGSGRRRCATPEEPRANLSSEDSSGREHLERDRVAEAHVFASYTDAHPAAAKDRAQAVASEVLSRPAGSEGVTILEA